LEAWIRILGESVDSWTCKIGIWLGLCSMKLCMLYMRAVCKNAKSHDIQACLCWAVCKILKSHTYTWRCPKPRMERKLVGSRSQIPISFVCITQSCYSMNLECGVWELTTHGELMEEKLARVMPEWRSWLIYTHSPISKFINRSSFVHVVSRNAWCRSILYPQNIFVRLQCELGES
jgi:hypothetical protein